MSNIGLIERIDATQQSKKMKDSYFLNTGSPHFASYVNNISDLESILEIGQEIRFSEAYKKNGVNVNLMFKQGLNAIEMRTYERGVENETLSCGTGVTAAALVHASKLSIEKGEIEVFTRGGSLNVSFSFDGESFQDVWLKGSANYVFKGELDG